MSVRVRLATPICRYESTSNFPHVSWVLVQDGFCTYLPRFGGMVERFKTAPWKGVGPFTGVRRFESYFHRHFWKINPNGKGSLC